MALGLLLLASAGGAVAEKIGLMHYFFLQRQIIFLFVGIFVMLILTQFNEKWIKRLIFVGFIVTLVLLILIPFVGDSTKGAKRWINIGSFSLQPSEFLKPFYMGFLAIMLAQLNQRINFKMFLLCLCINAIVISLFILQPDFGMAITNTLVMLSMVFIAGLKISWILLLICCLGVFFYCGYIFFPHVSKRIDQFLSPIDNNNYQVSKSISSYLDGGFFGKGPGEGTIKYVLPDAHTDFIFAVAAEEFGMIFCLLLIFCFGSFVIRGFWNLGKQSQPFNIFASFGVLMHFSLQFIFNIGVTLNIFPTKGMTLPFISYGGSSIIAFSIAAGIFLNVSKSNFNQTTDKRKFLFVKAEI